MMADAISLPLVLRRAIQGCSSDNRFYLKIIRLYGTMTKNTATQMTLLRRM